MKLIFGVWDVPYSKKESVTTGEVANRLESKYHIMGTYLANQGEFVAQEIAERLSDNLMRRTPIRKEMSLSGIEHDLKSSISQRKFDQWIGPPLVPTKAALMGVSLRFKSGKRRGKAKVSGVERPSFIDTGIYQRSIRVVLKDD